MPLTFKYGVAPPEPDAADLRKLLEDIHPEQSQGARLKLLEQKVAVLTVCVEGLLQQLGKKER